VNAAPEVNVQIPEILEGLFRPKPFKVMHGGRGGAKSHSVAQWLILEALKAPHRILCVREIQKSLAQSSMQVIKDYIKRLGLDAYFDPLKSEIRCNLTGATIGFSGLQDHTAESIKSFEGATRVWVEEAHSVSDKSWNILIPTIVRTDGAEIIATFNPDQETDYVYKRFVKGKDPDAWVQEVNWRDNPWFNQGMETERLKTKALNDDLYNHVWEGKCRSAAGLIFKRRWFRRYKLGEHVQPLSMYLSTDYAGAPDPDEPDREPDWNEFGVAGLGQTGALWFIDWFSAQDDADGWIPPMLGLIKKHEPRAMFEEKGAILRSIDGAISRAMQRAGIYAYRHPIASASSKADRALGFAAYASTNEIYVPECDWGDRLINQLCAFTGQDGKTDDMVDVCSLLGRGIKEMQDAMPPVEEKRTPVIPFTRAHIEGLDRESRWLDDEKQRYYK
jgi:hypothetical protein